MILTITLNPALDRTLHIEEFTPGSVLFVKEVKEVASGKGINVARVVRLLGGEVMALGLLGGPSGGFIEESLKKEGVPCRFTKIKGNTRSNLTLLNGRLGEGTHLVEPGPMVTPREMVKFKNGFKLLLNQAKAIVFSGSLPQGAKRRTYGELIGLAKVRGINTILDSRGDGLTLGARARPWLLKPNLLELEELCGRRLKTEKEILKGALSLIENGIRLVVVSLGREGAIGVGNGEAWKAGPPKVKEVDSVGSGDALLAGFLHSYLKGKGIEDSLRLGTACGAANVMNSGTCILRKSKIFLLQKRVKLRRLK